MTRGTERWIVASVAGAAITITSTLAWGFTVDDAFIVARYAENLVQGLGHVFSPGDAPSDGITSPLWLLVAIAAASVRSDPITAQKVVGLLATLASAVWCIARAYRRAQGRARGVFAAATFATSGSVVAWAIGGLETGAALLAMTALMHARRLPVRVLAALAIAAIRPELVPAAAVVAWARTRTPTTRGRAIPPIAVAAGVFAIALYRFAMFGNAIPLASRAKSEMFAGHAFLYVVTSLLLVGSFAGWVLAFVGARRVGYRALGGALLVHLLCIAAAGGDWMAGARLLVPMLPIYVWVAGEGFARLARARRANLRRLAAPLLAWVVSMPMVGEVPLVVEGGVTLALFRDALGPMVAELRRPGCRIALVDIGYLGRETGCSVIDLGGVTDPRIGDAHGGHLSKMFDVELLTREPPTAVVVRVLGATDPRALTRGNVPTSRVERRALVAPYVRGRFRFVSSIDGPDGYGYAHYGP